MLTNEIDRHGERLKDNGFSVIPIQPGTKRPGHIFRGAWRPLDDWQKYADQPAKDWRLNQWASLPGAGAGIICGRSLAAVDIDYLDEGLVRKVCEISLKTLGDTSLVRIGKAPKRILLFRVSEAIKKRKVGRVEVLGQGQQFVAFGVHPETQEPYHWVGDSPADVHIQDIPEITPEQLDAFFKALEPVLPEEPKPDRKRDATRAGAGRETSHLGLVGTPEAARSAVAAIPNNTSYDEWVRVGLALKGAVPGENGRAIWLDWCAKHPTYGDETYKSSKKWDRLTPTTIGAGTLYDIAMSHGWVPPDGVHLNPVDAKLADNDPAAPFIARLLEKHKKEFSEKLPAGVMDLDGGLKECVDWMTQTAFSPQPFLNLGASLAMFGALLGRMVRSETNLRTNIYVIGMADSGGGKDHPRKKIIELLTAANASDYLGGEEIKSDTAFVTAMERFPAKLFMLDEFGLMLQGMLAKRAAAHMKGIWQKWMTFYTSSESIYLGAEYADQKLKPRQHVNQPCACIFGTTVPGQFWAALEGASKQDGSLARLSLFRTDCDYPDRQSPPAIGIPQNLIDLVGQVRGGVPGHDYGGNIAELMMGATNPTPYTAPVTGPARTVLQSISSDMMDRLRDEAQQDHRPFVNRMWAQCIKFALIRASVENPQAPEITKHHVDWAWVLTEHTVNCMVNSADAHVSDSEVERKHKKVAEIIRSAGAKGISKSDLTRRTQFLAARERGEILNTLKESGQISINESEKAKNGKSTIQFYSLV